MNRITINQALTSVVTDEHILVLFLEKKNPIRLWRLTSLPALISSKVPQLLSAENVEWCFDHFVLFSGQASPALPPPSLAPLSSSVCLPVCMSVSLPHCLSSLSLPLSLLPALPFPPAPLSPAPLSTSLSLSLLFSPPSLPPFPPLSPSPSLQKKSAKRQQHPRRFRASKYSLHARANF